jgi:C4-dicarboxylate-specific signal transduction histidine kinase
MTPPINAKGEIIAGVHIARDVTEKKRHEELLAAQQKQLEEINSSLEHRIEKAVAELRNKDDILIQQSRLTAMGEMISNIAHQWRQPLNNIGLIVQSMQLAIKANDLTERQLDEDVAETMTELQHISETINNFRNFFSYEKEMGPFIINELVSRALLFVEPSLKSKGIRIELDEQPDVAAEGFPNEYLQALLNIILNARDALLEHQVAQPLISIRIFQENGRSVVTIRDNGAGIREDALPKIFDPYFTTKQQCNGTGIGLYMAKMIIEKKMHGSLSARNVGGAEFRIEL